VPEKGDNDNPGYPICSYDEYKYVAAHEFGYILGLRDTYHNTSNPDYNDMAIVNHFPAL